MSIKAILLGVSYYPTLNLEPLPLCKNDIFSVRTALINGLKVDSHDIILCGKNGYVTIEDMVNALKLILNHSTPHDTLIFYFSGHGGKNTLAFSDNFLNLQNLIEVIESTPLKNKIIILDSCHSGSFSVHSPAQMALSETVESFAGKGYAVLASCGSEQNSGFNPDRPISLYTSFLCDALNNPFLIRQGKKSLESINQAIFQYATAWNRKGNSRIQDPIFRSNIGGTIYFEVQHYNPYKVKKVYEETDFYIIYAIEPVHHGMAKRLSAKIILRYESSDEEISNIANEINQKIINYDVYQNQKSEQRYKGKPANIIWCYFGYDEDDMIDGNFLCHSTWVDDTQDKKNWYTEGKNIKWVNGIHFNFNSSYTMIKKLMHGEEVNPLQLINEVKSITAKVISLGEKFIQFFREYCNKTITEKELIQSVKKINTDITQLYLDESNLNVPPKKLHGWFQANIQIVSTIQDLTLYYDERYNDKWTEANKLYLINSTIKRYADELENLRELEDVADEFAKNKI